VRLAVSPYLGLVALVLCILVMGHFSLGAGVLFGLVLLLGSWSLFSDWSGRGLHEPITGLNLDEKQVAGEGPYPPRPPQTPADWLPLFSLPRPRTVFVPLLAKLVMAIEFVAFVAGIGWGTHIAWQQRPTLLQWRVLLDSEFLIVLWLAGWTSIGIAHIRREFSARALLQNGEVTTGLITNWRSGRHGKHVTYRFWTSTGLRFERQAQVLSSKEVSVDKRFVPVFYLPNNPSQSIALCSTAARVRVGEHSGPKMENITSAV